MGDQSTWCVCLAFIFFLVYLFTWIIPSDLVCFSLFLFYSQRSSRVGEQVWRACLCSCWVCEHYRRFWRSSGSLDLSSSLLGTKAFPLRPSHYSLWRKKWVILGRKYIVYLSPSFLLFLFFSLSIFLTSLLFLFSFAEMTTKFNQEFYARIKAKKKRTLLQYWLV